MNYSVEWREIDDKDEFVIIRYLLNMMRQETLTHLFIRKYKEIDGKVEPYIYIGKGNTVDFEGEKPITVKIKLENEVPTRIYTEFVEKV